MKVTGQQPPRASDLASGKSREAEAKPERKREATAGPPPAENRTSLAMRRIQDATRTTPDIRAERVEAIRQRIQNGEYTVDADRLAQNLLTESLRDDVEKP